MSFLSGSLSYEPKFSAQHGPHPHLSGWTYLLFSHPTECLSWLTQPSETQLQVYTILESPVTQLLLHWHVQAKTWSLNQQKKPRVSEVTQQTEPEYKSKEPSEQKLAAG